MTVYCPNCKDEKLYNPCDPGCCTALACPACRIVYKLVEACRKPCECHYHWCLAIHDEEVDALI